jgi:uncharacterized membrane protein
MMFGWDGSGLGVFGMVLTMVVFWGALGAIAFFLVRSSDRGREVREPDATEVLRGRFANGEIPKDDYQDRLKVLRETRR